jgi:hypothetical protein
VLSWMPRTSVPMVGVRWVTEVVPSGSKFGKAVSASLPCS